MNVYVSVDMEGRAGFGFREQTDPIGSDRALARRALEAEAHAAIADACTTADMIEAYRAHSVLVETGQPAWWTWIRG